MEVKEPPSMDIVKNKNVKRLEKDSSLMYGYQVDRHDDLILGPRPYTSHASVYSVKSTHSSMVRAQVNARAGDLK